jgi:hypothetical protein
MQKLTIAEFIAKAIIKHGRRYDYSKVKYVNNRTKVKIICPKHGVFEQTPRNHLSGRGCVVCAGLQRQTTEQFIEKAIIKHGRRYDYSKVKYVNNHTKVKIICPKHGVFKQTPNRHLSGDGCAVCVGLQRQTTEQFIEKAVAKHNNKYDYSKVKYVNTRTKVKIICPKHGIFEQTPRNHLSGNGCPSCNYSKGEQYLAEWLTINNIQFIPQYTIKKCKHKRPLPFDFAICINNRLGLIEYQGDGHYGIIEYSNSYVKNFKRYIGVKKHDRIKKDFCIRHNIPLLIIPYMWTDNRINEELCNFIASLAP